MAPRYIGLFPAMARVGIVAYQLELPPELSDMHNVFHVSQLRRCISPPEKKTDLAEIELAKDLTYEERPVKILIRWKELLAVSHGNFTRFNGCIIPSQNQPRNQKNF